LLVVPALEHIATVASRASVLDRGRNWATALLDLVFPPFCPVCRQRLGDGRRDPLCGSCWQRIERIVGPYCRTCGLPFLRFGGIDRDGGHSEAHLCGECRRRRPPFAYARSAAQYGEVAREAMHAFKFGRRRALASPLGDLLAEINDEALPEGRPDLLIPVPLYPAREHERGFNQSLLLARRLGRAWRIPVRTDVLVRTVPTPPQSELGAEARRANVRGAFSLRRPELCAGRHVIVVDDVFTTGSTVAACARCLKKGGARAVGVLTVARAMAGTIR
jgi:ComF family protein